MDLRDKLAREIGFAGRKRNDVSDGPDDFWLHSGEAWRAKFYRQADAIMELLKGAVKPLDQWAEEDGDVIWWCWDGSDWLGEAPYVGSPLDLGQTVECHTNSETGESPAARFQVGGWPGYHTHWTRLPSFPTPPQEGDKQ